MLIIPAIDIKDGCVVRLRQGKFSQEKIYSDEPLKVAKGWQRQGARLIHVVDLDGALSGTLKNLVQVRQIIRAVDIPVEFGGGIRTMETIKQMLELGIKRVVLGTKALEDEHFLKAAFNQFKERIIVSIDASRMVPLTRGWKVSRKDKDLFVFARNLKKMGFRQLIYTDTLKDGTLQGPNIKGIERLLKETGLKLIASAGISSLDDIARLKPLEKKGLLGIIVGKALYEGRFRLDEALRLAGEGS